MDSESEEQPGQIPDEAENLLNGMDAGPEPGQEPGQEHTPEEPGITPELAAIQAGYMVAFATSFFERHPAVQYPDLVKQELVDSLTPVIIKYDGVIPEWLAKLIENWKEEFALAKVVAGVTYGTIMAVKHYNAQQAAAQAEAGTGAETGAGTDQDTEAKNAEQG